MKNIKNISIILKPNEIDEFKNFLPELINWLIPYVTNIYFLNFEKERLTCIFKKIPKKICFIDKSNLNNSTDLVISLGGDGTLIGICRDIKEINAPIFGINLGKLGFLTEFLKKNYHQYLKKILDGDYKTSTMNSYVVAISDNSSQLFEGSFLNDASISKSNISRPIHLSVSVEDEHIFNIVGDGVIVSGPQGSTAYSLSAGGPIIHPTVNALALTPICPHTLSSRPLVLPDNLKILVDILEKHDEVVLTLDGQLAIPLTSESIICIKKHNTNIFKIIKNPDRTYFQNLKNKFIQGNRY